MCEGTQVFVFLFINKVPFNSQKGNNDIISFNQCYSITLALGKRTVSQVSDVVHGPLVLLTGSVCAEYNEDVMSIRSTVHSCKSSNPRGTERYSSTDQYKCK